MAVCEYPLTTGFADYLLFVDRHPIGVIEAKAVGQTLSGVEPQASAYCAGLKPDLKSIAWCDPPYDSPGPCRGALFVPAARRVGFGSTSKI